MNRATKKNIKSEIPNLDSAFGPAVRWTIEDIATMKTLADQGILSDEKARAMGLTPLFEKMGDIDPLNSESLSLAVELLNTQGDRLDALSRQLENEQYTRAQVENRADMYKNQALIDPLTKLYNRRFLRDDLERKLDKLRRGKSDVVLIALLDVDRFKKINDKFGHDVGDEILRFLAQHGKDLFRAYDIFGRWGGEEFLATADNGDLTPLIDRINSELCASFETEISGPAKMYRGSVSGGIVLVDQDAAQRFTLDELMKTADKSLYKAKQTGRARVFVTDFTQSKSKAFLWSSSEQSVEKVEVLAPAAA